MILLKSMIIDYDVARPRVNAAYVVGGWKIGRRPTTGTCLAYSRRKLGNPGGTVNKCIIGLQPYTPVFSMSHDIRRSKLRVNGG